MSSFFSPGWCLYIKSLTYTKINYFAHLQLQEAYSVQCCWVYVINIGRGGDGGVPACANESHYPPLTYRRRTSRVTASYTVVPDQSTRPHHEHSEHIVTPPSEHTDTSGQSNGKLGGTASPTSYFQFVQLVAPALYVKLMKSDVKFYR